MEEGLMSTTPGDFGTRLTRLEAARKELEDSLVVMAHLEARQSQMIKEQAEYMVQYEKRLRESERRNNDIDKRIADLVSAIGVLISRRPQ
jgi:septal ring factor EnvC (AmiA/AmiB activator)